MSRRDVRDPTLTPKEKTRLRQKIDREWMPALSSSEAKCMAFLFNMVTDWSKSRDRVKQDQFVNGTANVAGTGLSLRTVIRALASLTDKGAVERLRTPRGHVYTINFDWSPAVQVKARKAPAKATPAPAAAPVICQTGTSRYAKLADAQFRGIPIQEIPDNRAPRSDGPASFRGKTPEKERTTPYVDPLDLTNLRATWTAAIAEAFPDITPSAWGQREAMQACKFVNLDDKAKRATALDVFAWSIRSWRQIMAARFAWMTTEAPPTFPDVSFMAAFRAQFYDAWNDRERLRSEMTLNSKDRLVRRLMHQGASHAEAHKEAEARDALAAERIKVAEKAAKLDTMMRRAEQLRTPTLQQRLAALAEPKKPRTPTRGPVCPGIEGGETSFDRMPAVFGAY